MAPWYRNPDLWIVAVLGVFAVGSLYGADLRDFAQSVLAQRLHPPVAGSEVQPPTSSARQESTHHAGHPDCSTSIRRVYVVRTMVDPCGEYRTRCGR